MQTVRFENSFADATFVFDEPSLQARKEAQIPKHASAEDINFQLQPSQN